MLQLNYSDSDFYSRLDALLDRREVEDSDVMATVQRILHEVRRDGDKALLAFSRQFDGLDVTSMVELELSEDAINRHCADIDPDLELALNHAAERITRFHEKETGTTWTMDEGDGTRLGQIVTPLDRVGVYVPGGKAAYPSSVLMTVIPARVAGVREIIMTVPTPGGEINSTVLAAARIAGVDRIFTIGGAQAVAALAYGTESVPAVDKIVGPGNVYVATAKKMVFGDVGIDMIAGPSEVVVICDKLADPQWVAMDLFAQAEHDEQAQSIAITTSKSMAGRIETAISELLPGMKRREIIEQSLKCHGAVVIVENLDQAAEVANHIAPEHLELMVDDVDLVLGSIRNAGAIFAGKYSAEVLGDYCAGPNHVLPTSGTARFSSPLGVYDFQKRSSLIQASPKGAGLMAVTAAKLAESEGLEAHQRSALFRLSGDDE